VTALRIPWASWPDRGTPLPAAADALLHPVAVGAILVLVANDHVFKSMWPGWITGKLSDVAGLAFFPLAIVGIAEILLLVVGRWRGPSERTAVVASVATAVAFTLVKATALGAASWSIAMGAAQSLPAMTSALLVHQRLVLPHTTIVVRDSTDLVALPAIFVALWILRRRLPRQGKQAPQGSEGTKR
jgi:hypothetical protein